MPVHILAIDQGTTGSTVLVVEIGRNADGSAVSRTLGRATTELPQHYPQPGWVSHDVDEIWATVEASAREALQGAGVSNSRIDAVGITNQRETTALWERRTGTPIDRAIVWQCRRTAAACDELKKDEPTVMRVREKTGLVIDAYFSATKIAWLLDHVPGARRRAEAGELAFGTVDSLLVHRLTGGSLHVTDASNASRTLLMDLRSCNWDAELARIFRVPPSVLPRIVGNAEKVGVTRDVGFLPADVPIAGMAGDQQAALFGQACFAEGDAKCTYGTGAFALMNIGGRPILSQNGLVTTVAWHMGNQTTYALEGSAFIAGAAVQWLRDGLGVITRASQVEELARRVSSSEGVVFVPALAGLGAPYWDQGARGIITGLTRATTAAHLARATLEGIAFQVRDLLDAMSRDAGRRQERLRVDGGAAANDLLMQFQADVGDVVVERPTDVESTARGAAMLAALGVGALRGTQDAASLANADSVFRPRMTEAERVAHVARWRDAVGRARSRQ